MARSVSAARPGGARLTLPAFGARAISVQALLLVSASFLLPAAAHLAGLPVRLLLPMHWPVLLVGLCYGWRSGALVGLMAPGLSHLVSGMPAPVVLPAMTVELAAYGFLAGFLRENLRCNRMVATLGAIVVGRIVFLLAAVLSAAVGDDFLAYLTAAMAPGLPAALAQALVLPLIAGWWVGRDAKD